MDIVENQRMFETINKLWSYAERLVIMNGFNLTHKEFNAFKYDAGICFIPLINWSGPLISHQKIRDTRTNQIIWDGTQTLRFAVGAGLLSLGYKMHMNSENLKRSVIAKTFYKCQMGILDDLIDRGNYDYSRARELYGHVVGSMCSVDFDCPSFQEELDRILNPGQLGISDLISSITYGFNKFFLQAPRYNEVMPLMQMLDDRVIEGQALTVLQKVPHLDLERLRKTSERFFALEDGLGWHEKLANYISGGARYNLIDIAYTNEEFDWRDVDNILKIWYFYDIIVVLLNNIVNIKGDLKDGIYNLSLIDMKNGDISSVNRDDPMITLADYEKHILRNAELADKALKYVFSNGGNRKFYLLVTLMLPIVMMADWIGRKDRMIEMFVRNVSLATGNTFTRFAIP